MKTTVNQIASGGANAIVIHKGLVEGGTAAGERRGSDHSPVSFHLAVSLSQCQDSGVHGHRGPEDWGRRGFRACQHRQRHGTEMLADLGQVCREAAEWGVPVLAMLYPRGERIKDEYDPG